MTGRSPVPRPGEHGFTLVETLASLALTGLILSALATLTGQWMPGWNRGFDRVQHTELISTSMRRIAADLAAAEFVPAGRTSPKPLFEGSALSITFVRTALGPNAGTGLDVVRLGEIMDQQRLVTVRARAPYAPLAPEFSGFAQANFADPVVLLRSPLRLSFAYAGPDRVFRDEWRDMDALPTSIMLTVRDAASARGLSSVTQVHVNAPARRGAADDDGRDAAKDAREADEPADTTKSKGGRS